MRFSVIIPIYNGERFLDASIGSVLKQDFDDYELILVNDGSTDESLKKCQQFQKNCSKIIVLDKPNGGQASARNLGLKKASGEYIIFLDCDDEFVGDHFFSLLDSSIMASNKDIIAYKYMDYFENNGETSTAKYSFSDIKSESFEHVLMALIRKDAFFCSAWSKCVRRALLTDNSIYFDENSKCEDMDWYFSVVSCAKTIDLLDYEAVRYRRRVTDSVTSSANHKNLEDYLRFINDWDIKIESISQSQIGDVLRCAIAKLYVNLLIAYVACKDNRKKNLSTEIYSFKRLLKYDYNPTVRKVSFVSGIIGIRGVMILIKILLVAR